MHTHTHLPNAPVRCFQVQDLESTFQEGSQMAKYLTWTHVLEWTPWMMLNLSARIFQRQDLKQHLHRGSRKAKHLAWTCILEIYLE